jgi:type IV conjugative transfer system pilin TraA
MSFKHYTRGGQITAYTIRMFIFLTFHRECFMKNIIKKPIQMLSTALLFSICYIKAVLADDRGDLLVNAGKKVQTTFGQNPQFIHWLFLAEVVVATMAYIKVRNPAIFIGLALLLIFTHIGFSFVTTS